MSSSHGPAPQVRYYEVALANAMRFGCQLRDYITRGNGMRFQKPPAPAVVFVGPDDVLFLSETALKAFEALGLRLKPQRALSRDELPPDAQMLVGGTDTWHGAA